MLRFKNTSQLIISSANNFIEKFCFISDLVFGGLFFIVLETALNFEENKWYSANFENICWSKPYVMISFRGHQGIQRFQPRWYGQYFLRKSLKQLSHVVILNNKATKLLKFGELVAGSFKHKSIFLVKRCAFINKSVLLRRNFDVTTSS